MKRRGKYSPQFKMSSVVIAEYYGATCDSFKNLGRTANIHGGRHNTEVAPHQILRSKPIIESYIYSKIIIV